MRMIKLEFLFSGRRIAEAEIQIFIAHVCNLNLCFFFDICNEHEVAK